MNQLRNFYIHAIAEDAGLLESNVERLISAKIIADYNEASRNIAEISQSASEQSKTLKGREFFYLSAEDIARRVGILPENLNKTIGNGTLKIPHAFEENYKTFYALEKKDFENIKDSFSLAWKKTVALEKEKSVISEHSFEEPASPSAEKEEHAEESSTTSPETELLEEQLSQEKQRKKEEAKRKKEERQRRNREVGEVRKKQIKENRKREERLRTAESDSGSAFYPTKPPKRDPSVLQSETSHSVTQAIHYSNDTRYDSASSPLDTSGPQTDSTTYSDGAIRTDRTYGHDEASPQSAITYDAASGYSDSSRMNDSSRQTGSSFLPEFQQNPFQVYAGSLTSSFSSEERKTTTFSSETQPVQPHASSQHSVEQLLSGVKQDSDTITASEHKEQVTSNYSSLTSQQNTTITYQGNAITSYSLTNGATSMEFSSAQEMLASPYCSDNATVCLTTTTGDEVHLSSYEVTQLRDVSSPEFMETNLQPISSYYEQQMIENNCFYEGMPIVAIERTQQDEAQIYDTSSSVDSVYQSLNDKNGEDLYGNYQLMLANGESVSVTPENFQQIQYVLPIAFGADDGVSNQEMAQAIQTRSEFFSAATGLASGSKIPSTEMIQEEHIESIRKKMEPSRELTMQESGLFKNVSSNKKATSMMFMSDFSEDFDHRPIGPSNGSTTDNVSLNHIHHREYMEHGFACAVGQVVFRTACGPSDLMRSVRKIGRYAGWVNPLLQGVNTANQQKARLGKFKKDNQMGLVKRQLRTCGVNIASLYERDKLGRRKIKEHPLNGEKSFIMKKQLSANDIKGIMFELDKKFALGNAGSVKLSQLSSKELNKLIKQGGKNGELAKAYQNMKGLQNIAGKKNRHFANMRQSLKGVMSSLLNDAEFYQGIRLISSYARIAKRTVGSFVRGNRKLRQKLANGLVKHARPLRAYADVKLRNRRNLERKKRHAKRKRERQKTFRKNLRRDKRWERLTGRKKSAWKRDIHKRFNNSKFGQRFNKVRKKLNPVKVKVNRVQSFGFGALDKIFGGIGKVLNLGNVIKKFALTALGYFMLVCFIILMAGGIAIQLFGVSESETESTQPEKYDNLLAQGIGELVQKDNAWLLELKDLPNQLTPQSATGKKQYTLEDPFTGEKKEITSFGTGNGDSTVTYKCYDAWGWDAIFNRTDGIDKKALKEIPGHQISEYSNSMAVLACASYYCLENSIETSGKNAETNHQNFSKVYNMLWEHSHCYGTAVSDKLQICPGQNCTKTTMDCRSLDDEKLKKKNISDIPYRNAFLKQMGKTCEDVTYYCNDPSSWEGLKFFEKGSTKQPSGKGCKGNEEMKKYDATLYCSWSGKENLNPEPPTSVPNGAKGSFSYHYKTEDDTISSSMDGCKDAKVKKNSNYFDTALITHALNSDICLLKKGKNFVKRKVDNKEYYCAYTSNIQQYTKVNYMDKVNAKDGIFLFDAKYVDPKSGTITPSADGTICTNERISWFYNCQGHEVDGYSVSYCPGHKGCKGHEVAYCLGHLELEVYSSIAGFNDLEIDTKQKPLYNIASVDDLFFQKNKDGDYAPDDKWDYAKDWKGFREEGRDISISKLSGNWQDNFGISPESLQLNNVLGER